MNALYTIISIVYILGCVALVTIILMQKKRTAGLTGNLGGMGASQTYWDKNKSRSLEGTLEKYTKIGGAIFFIVTLAISIIK